MARSFIGINAPKKVGVYNLFGDLEITYPSLRECTRCENIAVTTLYYCVVKEIPYRNKLYKYI